MTAPIAKPNRNFRFLLMAVVLPALVLLGLLLFYRDPILARHKIYPEVVCWLALLGLVGAYIGGYQALRQQATPLRMLVLGGLLLAMLAALIPPFHSTDLFGYINRGWQQWHYHLNPYVQTVDDIPNWGADPMITDHWVNNPSPYGFLYLLIARMLCMPADGNLSATVLVFKAFNVLMHAGIAGLIWLAARRAQAHPERALYLYAFNPLILIHGLANGHNDLIMGFFITLSAYAAIMGSWTWILPALVAATLIKYGAVVILPFALLFLIRQQAWRALALGLLAGIGVFLASGWSFLGEWRAFHLKEIGRNALVSHGSLHSLVFSGFKTIGKNWLPAWYAQREAVRDVLKNILLAIYAVFYGGLLLLRGRDKTYPVQAFVSDALLVLVVLVCLISLKFYPWYVGMFFPLALLQPEGHWLRRFVIVLSCAQMLSITFIGQSHLINYILETLLPLVIIARTSSRQPLTPASSAAESPADLQAAQ